MRTLKLIWLAAALVSAAVANAEIMYARFPTAVRSDRSLGARTLKRLKQGDAVNAVARQGRYYRVLVDGQEGWVYYNKLTDKKPEDVAALLSSGPAGGGLVLSELEAGGALRGLSRSAERYIAARNIPQWAQQAVEQMQTLRPSTSELEAFMREGRLGEYGEGGM